jgi:hypothetical protein
VVEEQPSHELSDTDRDPSGPAVAPTAPPSPPPPSPSPPPPPTLPPPTLPPPPSTGDQTVDAAVAPLADLSLAPLEDHPAVYEGVHRALTDRLADVEG